MEGTTLGDYFKPIHYTDEAIGQLINDLDEPGLLENTVIVIYGNHDTKIKKAEYNRFYNYDSYTDSIIDKKDENYNSQKDEWKLINPEETVSMEYIEERNAYAEEKIKISNAIDLIKKTRESDELVKKEN